MLLPLHLRVENRTCVVVGGGAVAARKCRTLAEHGARVRVVAPEFARDFEWPRFATDILTQDYARETLAGAWLVIAATNDTGVNAQVERDARAAGLAVLRTDDASGADFVFPATLRRGALTVSFGTDGQAPALARQLRDQAEIHYGEQYAALCDEAAATRGQPRVGRAYLVGAGPGDPDLLTIKGAECLRVATVVLHDALANPALLDHYAPRARRIDVSKRKGVCRHMQPEINAMLVDEARRGEIVVRLKGGDPMIFGRGGEEARALAEAGIPFEIVPGVSSLAAVPAYAGIPVTDREYGGSSVGVYTLHLNGGFGLPDEDWQRMAGGPATLVLFMGLSVAGEAARQLIRFGRAPRTPVAVIVEGTLGRQQELIGTLETIGAIVDSAKPAGPGLIVVGPVVRAAARMNWRTPGQDVILIRHGDIGANGRYIGVTDTPLSALGARQAERLRGLGFKRGWVSPLARSRQTAELAGIACEMHDDLREVDFGRWEGQTFSEIETSDAQLIEPWRMLAPDFTFPGGESLAAFDARIARLAARIEKQDGRVVLVTHGGVIRALVCHWLGRSAEARLGLDVAPASVTRLRLAHGRATTVALNERDHLEGL
jgi:uroporphyrin-III C-methyltransferase/precorrin-2 dehydrogenase/sirohydrochlorin ferrochelatase